MEPTADVAEALNGEEGLTHFLYMGLFLFRACRIQERATCLAWPGIIRTLGLPNVSWTGGLGRWEGAFFVFHLSHVEVDDVHSVGFA